MNLRAREVLPDCLLAVAGVGAVVAALGLFTGTCPHPLEITGTFGNVAGMLLIRKQVVWGWVGNVLASICIGVFSYWQQLYGQVFLQLAYFLPFSLYAFYTWGRPAGNAAPEWLTARGRLYAAALFFLFLLGAFAMVKAERGFALHLADIAGLSFVMTAYLLMALKKTDCWILLIPGNSAIVYLYVMIGSPLIAALNLFFLINGLFALMAWAKKAPPVTKFS